MKVICLQEKLQHALNLIEKTLTKSATLPILNAFLFEVKKGEIKISSTDLENAASITIPGKVEKEGKIALPGKIITNYINNLSTKKINLEAKKENLQIKSGGFEALIQGYKTEDFPIIPQIKRKLYFQLNTKELLQALSQLLNIPSLSEARPEISGIFFSFEKNILRLAATDSFRLGEKILPIKNDNQLSFILSFKGASEVLKLFENESEIKIYPQINQVFFEGENIQLISRLLEGDYPNYQEIIPKTFETKIIVTKEEFLQQLRAISIFTGRNNDLKLVYDPKTLKLKISARESGVGEGRSEIQTRKSEGKIIEILFNWKFLQDGLNNINDSQIFLGLTSQNTPALLRGENDKSYLYILMPIKNI